MNNKLKLKQIKLSGYKSINKEGQIIPFKNDLTVFLGANGAGKSNLISFFTMLNYMTTEALQIYIGENGFANSLLYYGIKQTTRLNASLLFENNQGKTRYKFSLAHAAGDTLIFMEETLSWHKNENKKPFKIILEPGIKESGLKESMKKESAKTSKIIYSLLRNCQVFQFHDTSMKANIRNQGLIKSDRYLYRDAGNLAAFLYGMKHKKNGDKYYNRIIRYIRQIMPQFDDFQLEPTTINNSYISLDWNEKGSEYLFGAHQISDGSLRFMALATLLLQPPDTLPSVIILDEPELGLHPSAISIFAGMCKTASKHTQVILATQSTRLVDEFVPDNIVIVERDTQDNCSVFKKLDTKKLSEWLNRYSMSELWEKNIVGGRP